MSFKNFKIHLKTINKHKIEVTKLCFKAGLYKQGILHDLSKYSLAELKTGWKYANGKRSPIDYEKINFGYSESWLHHFHRNKHHYEFWYTPDLMCCGDMPLNYIYEAVLDRVAAAKVYQKDKYTLSSAYSYFMKSKCDPIAMGDWNAARISFILKDLAEHDEKTMLNNIKNNSYEELFKHKDIVIMAFTQEYYK